MHILRPKRQFNLPHARLAILVLRVPFVWNVMQSDVMIRAVNPAIGLDLDQLG